MYRVNKKLLYKIIHYLLIKLKKILMNYVILRNILNQYNFFEIKVIFFSNLIFFFFNIILLSMKNEFNIYMILILITLKIK